MMTVKVFSFILTANVYYVINHTSGHDDLFFTIYEKIPVQSGNIHPAMWRYRARITLEHLTHALQQRVTTKGLVSIYLKIRLTLYIGYATQEPVLRVTQHLPDILYLQKLLFDHFHQRVDQVDALEKNIEEYLMTLQSGTMPNILDELFYSVFCNR